MSPSDTMTHRGHISIATHTRYYIHIDNQHTITRCQCPYSRRQYRKHPHERFLSAARGNIYTRYTIYGMVGVARGSVMLSCRTLYTRIDVYFKVADVCCYNITLLLLRGGYHHFQRINVLYIIELLILIPWIMIYMHIYITYI